MKMTPPVLHPLLQLRGDWQRILAIALHKLGQSSLTLTSADVANFYMSMKDPTTLCHIESEADCLTIAVMPRAAAMLVIDKAKAQDQAKEKRP